MKKYLILFFILSSQVDASVQNEKVFPPPPLSAPSAPKELQVFHWPKMICEGQNQISQFHLHFVWNPLEEIISVKFRQEFPLNQGREPAIEWSLTDIPVGQWNSESESQDFELNYEEPNSRDCSYRVHFMKGLPGFLKSQVELNMDCDGIESSLTLDCQYR